MSEDAHETIKQLSAQNTELLMQLRKEQNRVTRLRYALFMIAGRADMIKVTLEEALDETK